MHPVLNFTIFDTQSVYAWIENSTV